MILLTLIGTFAGCPSEPSPAPTPVVEPPHSIYTGGPHAIYTILIDRSDGMQDAETMRACPIAKRLAEGFISRLEEHEGLAELRVFATGEKTVGSVEIYKLASFEQLIAPAEGTMHASAEKSAAAKAERERVAAEIEAACKSKATPAAFSPLHHALESVVKDMQQECFDGKPCEVAYYTDLQDNEEPWICDQVFAGKGCPKRGKNAGPTTQPQAVSAPKVSVTACGYDNSADLVSKLADAGTDERLRATWNTLFPDLNGGLKILSSCP